MRDRLLSFAGELEVAAFASIALVALSGCRRHLDKARPSSTTVAATPAERAPAEPEVPIIGSEIRVHPVGELGRAHDYSMSVESVKDCVLAPPFAPRTGFVKVGVEVELGGTTGLEVPASPFYATLRSSSGDGYAATLAGCEPCLPSVRVVGGKKARGFVTFEVPKTARQFELTYSPVVIGPGVEELRFAVAR